MRLGFATRRFARIFLTAVTLFVMTASGAQAATAKQLFHVDASSGVQHWVVYDDQSIHWVTPSCAAELQARQLPSAPSEWAKIQNYRRIVPSLCSNVLLSLPMRNANANAAVLMRTSAGVDDGWIRYRDGTRNWVNPSCRQTLQGRGITEEVTAWSDIARLPVRNSLTCPEIIRLFSGASVPTNRRSTNTPDNFSSTCIGMNDDFAHSWDGGSLVADAFKQAKGPVLNDHRTMASVDRDGWPNGYQTVNFVLGEGDHDLEEIGSWVLLPYDQTGVWLQKPTRTVWEIEGASHSGIVDYSGVLGHRFVLSNAHINLKIAAGAIPPNSLNRWHMVPESVAGRYAQAMRDNGFRYIFDDDRVLKDLSFPVLHPNAKRQLADFCRIRFMLGDSVNSLNFTGYGRDRSRPANPTFRTLNGDGIPYEWEVAIANHLGINIWHVDHVKTWDAWLDGDDYLDEQARYFATHLRGNVIREYANEIWNTSGPFFQQTNWATTRTPYAGVSQPNWKLVNNRYGKRAWDTAGPWLTAFASRRGDLDNTIGIHTGCPDCVEHRLTSPQGQSFGDRIDSVSGTFYLGSLLATNNPSYAKISSNGVAGVDELHRASLASLKVQLKEIMSAARPHVSRWHMYEGGSHMNFPTFNPGNLAHVWVTGKVVQYWKSLSFTQVLTEFKSWWANQDGSGELMWFNLYGLDNPDNPFGYFVGAGSPSPHHFGAGEFVRQN